MQTASVMKELVGTWSPRILGVLRIVSGLMFFEEGTAKLFNWPHVELFDNVQLISLLAVAAVGTAINSRRLIQSHRRRGQAATAARSGQGHWRFSD